MMKIFVSILFVLASLMAVSGQAKLADQIAILKAEDARDASALLAFLKSADAATLERALLAAGRIADDSVIGDIAPLLTSGTTPGVRKMAAFAIGEIESVNGAGLIVRFLNTPPQGMDAAVTARLVEAAGKIAAANASDPISKDLGRAIIGVLEKTSDDETILLGVTALLRARPEGTDAAAARFLSHNDARIRADTANTLARVRAKNANLVLRKLLYSDEDPNVRANAARALGAAEDKEAYDLLLDAAVNGDDARVRVSAIRALASLKDTRAAAPLIDNGEKRLNGYRANGPDKTELLEIATAVSRLVEGKGDASAISFLQKLRKADGYASGETEAALARTSQGEFLKSPVPESIFYKEPWAASAMAQGMQTFAASANEDLRAHAGTALTARIAGMATKVAARDRSKMLMAMPDLMRAMAALKPGNLDAILRGMTENDDIFIRATAVELLAELTPSVENTKALIKAWNKGFITDKTHNDAQLATLDALLKVDRHEATSAALSALNSPDHLVRKKAFDILKTADTAKYPGLPAMVEAAKNRGADRVLPFRAYAGTRNGQLLNTDADYRRALARRNGSTKAVFTTTKGTFTIDLFPEEAPLTVDNFIKLARSRYFNGLAVHRVVANFVMQDGDNRGDGNGGPGWSIRCEVNLHGYDRGSVGMALSGKDTGGSQWFVTHAPQPHLDGGYTVFGKVAEKDMAVVDKIVRGDRIVSVRVIEGGAAPAATRKRR